MTRSTALLLPLVLLGAAPVKLSSRPQHVTLDRLPLSFEENQGQAGPQTRFLARLHGATMFFTPGEALLALRKRGSGAAVQLQFVGANPRVEPRGDGPLPGKVNYYLGKDPQRWRPGVPTYRAVTYSSLYPGIDLRFYGNQSRLEYDFIVAPGVDPASIQLRLQGADRLSLTPAGELLVATSAGEVRLHAPVLYQEVHGRRRPVSGGYVLGEQGQVRFAVGPYDNGRQLVIDPVLTYSTYLGAPGQDEGTSVAVDQNGVTYVTGLTDGNGFPATSPYIPTIVCGGSGGSCAPNQDYAFVTAFDPTGAKIVYSTVFGGLFDACTGPGFCVPPVDTNHGRGISLALNSDAYVAGTTYWSTFPTTPDAFQPNAGGGNIHSFLVRLNHDSGTISYATYMGGSGNDIASSVSNIGFGAVAVAGTTSSTDFPLSHAFQPAQHGSYNAFVYVLQTFGHGPGALVYSTYLGGTGTDGATSVVYTGIGTRVAVAGYTNSTNFPVESPLQATLRGKQNAFVVMLETTTAELRPPPVFYSTYLGGSGTDAGFGIATDGTGAVYVTGNTTSSDFPTKNPLQANLRGQQNAFVTKLSADGSSLVYSTYLGGGGSDTGLAAAVFPSAGLAYVAGQTSSADFPTTQSAPQRSYGGGMSDAFVAQLSPSGTMLGYATYLGGSDIESAAGLALDSAGTAYVTGSTVSTNFPTQGPYQAAHAGAPGEEDAFAAKISCCDASPPPLSLKFTQPNKNGWNSTTFSIQANAAAQPGIASITYSESGAQIATNVVVSDAAATIPITQDGTTTITLYATDIAGHSGTPQTFTVKLDTTPPTVQYTGNAGSYTIDQTVNITCSATDQVSGVASTNCANISGPAYTFPPGPNTFSATATDFAGNVGNGSTSFQVAVTYDAQCNLTTSFSNKPGVANSLCQKLKNAQAAQARGDNAAKAGLLGAYVNEVNAQTGKAFTASQAAILEKFVALL